MRGRLWVQSQVGQGSTLRFACWMKLAKPVEKREGAAASPTDNAGPPAPTTVIRQRERETGGRVPIVALTAHALKGDEQRCLEAGMDRFLAKPLRQMQLLEVLIEIAANVRNEP